MLGISEAAESIGMHTVGAKMSYNELLDDIPLPGIVHWRGNHFVVIVEATEHNVTVADPAADSTVVLPVDSFLEGWVGVKDRNAKGAILLMEPSAAFYSQVDDELDSHSTKMLFRKFLSYQGLNVLVGLSLLASLFLMFLFPFLFKTMVDKGVESQTPQVLLKVMAIWVVLFLVKAGLEALKNSLLSFIGRRVNLQMLVDFMRKILKLPLAFFHSRKADDIVQLLYDNTRLQRFLTQDLIAVFYAGLLLLVYAAIMAVFSWRVLLVFVAATLLQVVATLFLLKRRQLINYHRLQQASSHFHLLNELLRGIEAIRHNNAELAYRWNWERSEVRLNNLNNDWQKSHQRIADWSNLIGELRNILIIYLSLVAVASGQLSIGALVAILFILTQVGAPVRQIMDYLLTWQDVKHVLSRMDYIRSIPEFDQRGTINVIPEKASISGTGISFRYDEEESPWVFRYFDFTIEPGTVNCFIGKSGCGKTTLLKLLMGMMEPVEGVIKIGGVPLNDYVLPAWLEKCGVVPQNGYIFSASIARNIAIGEDDIDGERLFMASKLAGVLNFIDRFPNGFQTKLKEGGSDLSKGQQQCILIARALYRQPAYLFMDEPTNDFDSQAEEQILNGIFEAYRGKTVVLFSNRKFHSAYRINYIQMPENLQNILPGRSPIGGSKEVPSSLTGFNILGN